MPAANEGARIGIGAARYRYRSSRLEVANVIAVVGKAWVVRQTAGLPHRKTRISVILDLPRRRGS